MASRQPSLLVVSVIVALAQGCGDVVIEPLAPPPAGLVARLWTNRPGPGSAR